MIRHTAYEGCKSFGRSIQQSISCTITIGFSSFLRSVLGTTLSTLAAFTCGCIEKEQDIMNIEQDENIEEIEIEFKSEGYYRLTRESVLDIFTFNADSLGHLDAYQRVQNINNGKLIISSTGGPKKIFIYGNANLNKEDLLNIKTMNDLQKAFCRLEDIRREHPFMIGIADIRTGGMINHIINLKPMISEIILRSVCCDFSGTSYEGAHISDAKVYLTNVNAQCSLADTSITVQRFINMGMLNTSDIGRFAEPDIILQTLDRDIRGERIRTDICLICFQNCCKDESMGSPFTRIVLEGKIQGETYYWPLSINRTEQGKGISDNTRHVFDLTIRRKGCQDPDEEIFIDDSYILMDVAQWQEKEENTVMF